MRFLRQSLPCLSYCVEQLLKIFTKSPVSPAKESTCCCNMPLDLAITNLRRLRARFRPPASVGNKKVNRIHVLLLETEIQKTCSPAWRESLAPKESLVAFFCAWPKAHKKWTFHLFHSGVIFVCSIPGAFSLIILKVKMPSLLLFFLLLITSCILFVYPIITQ